MSDDLKTLEQWASVLLANLDPARRRQVTTKVAKDLRRSQQQRVKAQMTPEGLQYTPRKPRNELRNKKERIKKLKAAMFVKLRTDKHLKVKADSNEIAIGFFGRVARIARVHQYGLKDKVVSTGPEIKYPNRKILGFSDADKKTIRNSLLNYLE